MIIEAIKVAMSAVVKLADVALGFIEVPVELLLRRKLDDKEKKAARGVVIVGIAVAHVLLGYVA